MIGFMREQADALGLRGTLPNVRGPDAVSSKHLAVHITT